MVKARQSIRKLIFGITGFLVTFLMFRFFLVVLGADPSHFLSQIVFGVTDYLMVPFNGMFVAIDAAIIRVLFEIAVAMVFYIFLGIFLAGMLTAFLQDEITDIIAEILDLIFKVVEFLLMARLVLKLFGVASNVMFTRTIYSSTEWAGGLLPTVDILGGELEFSTLFILVAVIILDIGTEGLFRKEKKSDIVKTNTGVTHRETTIIRETPQELRTTQPQNINISLQQPANAPQPMPPRRANPQVINIHPPKSNQIGERRTPR